MFLSRNLTLSEVTKSLTAERRGIDNNPGPVEIFNLQVIANKVFQPLRDYFNVPIYISSGYRSKDLNMILGGSVRSHHLKGMALDIDQDGRSNITNAQVFNYIKDNLQFTQLIWEFGDEHNPAWVHVSYDEKDLKNQVLRSRMARKGVRYHEIK